jgi:GxxExxY protein
MTDLIFKEECYKIVGSCMKIHTKLGKGFKEIVYKDALEIEFKKDKNILFEREKAFNISYEEIVLPHRFNADFFLFGAIILEVKAVAHVPTDAFKQTINYLKASQVKLGILVNFGADKLEFQRIVCTY